MTTDNNNSSSSKEDLINALYDKTVHCPVCGKETKNQAVKKSFVRVTSRDSDSMVYYSGINPSFYEIVYCSECGYAALPAYFSSVKPQHIRAIQQSISAKWRKPHYPEIFDTDFAIKQHKLALHSAIIKEAKDSEKGLLCLRLSWLYRLLGDSENEKRFQLQTITCFENAYMNENFPIEGMDEYTIQYLIGELYRRIDNNDKAMQYFSNVLVNANAPTRIKEKIRDQRALITSEK